MPVEAGSARSSVDGLNAAGTNAFVQAMAPYFEDSPRFLARLAAARPFQDERHLFERAAAIADAMPEEEQVELVDAHPRIGAAARMMSVASLAEQGHERATQPVQADLDRLNAAYEARFGFRFVAFVAGRPRSEIVPLIEARLGRERGTELHAALTDVIAIARDRWRKAGLGEW